MTELTSFHTILMIVSYPRASSYSECTNNPVCPTTMRFRSLCFAAISDAAPWSAQWDSIFLTFHINDMTVTQSLDGYTKAKISPSLKID